MKELLLQKVVLPRHARLQTYWNLFYRAPRLSCTESSYGLNIPVGVTVDFATYFNSFSIQKWKLYTNIKKVYLSIKIKGKGIINTVSYHLNHSIPDRTVISAKVFNFKDEEEIRIEFPCNTNEQLFSFEILPFENSIFYNACFYGCFEENNINIVKLCLATTTCNKEDYICNNIQVLKNELLGESSEIRENLFIHVVDNGQSLKKDEIEGFHVTLHPNKNVGGSGGFARGMIESMHQTPEATHVLLMDDDVLILPESIRRTYILLSVLKDEWKNSFISGAMLEYEEMNIQHEDIGTVDINGSYRPLKGDHIDQSLLKNVLQTNLEYSTLKKQYAAWWYCCVPVKTIKENGFPLPLFVRVDDIEYSLRCKPAILSMTGICVWHMGFVNKYNISMELYQTYRNQLIVGATTKVEIEVESKLKYVFVKQLLQFDYNGAELICLAFEDFMKGPCFIENVSGEKLLKEHAKLNESLIPLSNYNFEVRLDSVSDKAPLYGLKKILFYITLNFHFFVPSFFLKKEPGIKCFDWHHQPAMQYRHSSILAVNPYERTANLRVQDRRRCKKLIARFCKDLIVYKVKQKKITANYSAKCEFLISEKFWKKYLEI